MKKRLTAMLVVLCMIVVATGCGKNYKVGKNGEVYNDYIQVNKWKGLEVEKVEAVEVTDEDVELSIESDLQTLTEYVEVTDRAAQTGDQVTIDYVGKLDGVAFDNGSADDQVITLGASGYIDGFDDGVVGHNAGETFDVPLTFPEDYSLNADLAGKAVVFTITLDKIEEVVVPELTDDVVAKLSETATTIDEYKAQVRADLEKSNQEAADEEMRYSLLTVLTEQCEAIEYPEERLEEMITTVSDYYTQMVYYYYGMTAEDLESTYGMTVEDMIGTTFEDVAKNQLLCEMAVELLAEVEGLEVTDEDYQAFLEEQAEAYGYESAEALEEAYEEANGEGSCRSYCLQEKVLDFLWENCEIVEPSEEETETTTDETTEGETDAQDETVTE